MKVNKGIRIRIKPNASQRKLLESHFGANRWLWNYFLDKRKREYQESKKGSTYVKDAAALTSLKHDGEHEWLNETSVASMQRTLKHLDDAYKSFFKGNSKFPNFKSKKKGDKSFTLAGGISVKGKRVCIPKFKEGFKFNRCVPSFDKINNITIRQVPSGKYYAILSVEGKSKELPKLESEAGIDLGLKSFAIFSDGRYIKHPRFTAKYAVELKKAQQHLSRKRLGSVRRNKQKLKVAKIYEKIANSRLNFLHQASAVAIKQYGVIHIEDLAVKNMVRNRCLSRSISDSGWSEFVRQLNYKSEWYGRKLNKIGRFYPSSKTCNGCGFIHQDLKLSDREWKCPSCKTMIDRDLNAAKNILAEGKRNFGAVILENKRGDRVRPRRLSAKASADEALNLH